MARAGKRVCVLERREILGGAAVTEEIVPGTFLSSSIGNRLLKYSILDFADFFHNVAHHSKNNDLLYKEVSIAFSLSTYVVIK